MTWDLNHAEPYNLKGFQKSSLRYLTYLTVSQKYSPMLTINSVIYRIIFSLVILKACIWSVAKCQIVGTFLGVCYVSCMHVLSLALVQSDGPFSQTLCIEKESYMDAI